MIYFNHFTFSALLTAFATFLLGIFVLLKNRWREKLYLVFALYSFTISLWSFCVSRYTPDFQDPTLIWGRLLHLGAILIPIFFVHFIQIFLEIKNRKILEFVYFLGILFICLDLFTHLFISGTTNKTYYSFPTPSLTYPLFFGFFALCVIYGIYELFKAYLVSSGVKRNQLKYLLLSSIFGYLGGMKNFMIVIGWELFPIYPFGSYAIPLYVAIVTYAIVRHQLMEIEVIIKKTVVFAVLFAFIFGVFITVAFLVGQLFEGGRILSFAVTSLIIILVHRPLENFLINTTDKFLFQKKYEYKQILKTFIDEVITVLNLDQVINSTLKLLDKTIHPYASAIFILNKVEDKYQLYNSHGLENKNIAFTSDSKLVTYLKKTHNPAIIKQIDVIIGVSPGIISEMNQLKATLVLPFMLHNDLIGFISLGKKKSDQEYTKDDLDVLLDLARTESIAVGNAQLLAEAAQAERRAAIGTMSAGINHEIGNPLNTINTKIQVFLAGIERGFYKDKSKEEIIEECKAVLNETVKQTNRIAEITRKLSNFAKPSKEFRPQLVNIPEEIEEVLAVVGHGIDLEKIRIERQFSSDPPKIMADKREIQQIFFNLIRNSAQAIESLGAITIKAFLTDTEKVHVEIQDTGKGIPDDKTHRIFEPFFTTKESNQGTGLGLSIVRQLVWKNKGEISFTSQFGVGSTFVLEFPKGAES